jgi:hypothetical protein
MIEQLVSKVFYTRNAAHLEHWKTKGVGSYARHVALGDFYDALIDNIDSIVEAHQGYFDLIAAVQPIPGPLLPKDIVEHISDECEWIDENREKIAKNVAAIENLIDNLAGAYMSVLYKLRNLQ